MYFSYYGSKYSRAGYYPRPRHRVIVEAFAGSAGYSVRHRHHDVLLFDVDPRVVGVWRYLIRATESEIRGLPTRVEHLDDHPHLPQEARWLIGFWLAKANATPRKRPSGWMISGKSPGSYWGPEVRERLARQVADIRHWRVEQKSCLDAPDIAATWFVDPPYQGRVGDHYARRFKEHYRLGEWCRSRTGQVIVCEHHGADWLPFRPLGPTGRRNYREVVWTGGRESPAGVQPRVSM